MEGSSRRVGLALTALALAPSLASAQEIDLPIERPRVAIAIDEGCTDLELEIVERIVGVELGADADLGESPDRATSRVRAGCEGEHVTLELDEPLTGKHLSRTIDLAGTPADGRSRLVALAMAELLSASWIELGMRREESVAIVDTHGGEETRAIALQIARARILDEDGQEDEHEDEEHAPPQPTTRPFGVRAIAVARLAGEQLHFAGGGGLGADWEFLAPLAIDVDVRVEQGSVEASDLGSVRTTSFWGGASIALRLPLGPNHADFGVGGRLGAGWLEGLGAAGVLRGNVLGPIASLCAVFHLSLHIAYSAYFHVGIEGAVVVLPVRGTNAVTGETIASIAGGQLALTAGFEIRPD